ncbi:MAG TPA: HAD family hydrolase [Myxococcota bacterium]
MTSTAGIAFFDFDGTILVKESTRLCAFAGMRNGFITPALAVRIGAAIVAHKLGLMTRQELHRICFLVYADRTPAATTAIVSALNAQVLRRWHSAPMLEAIARHRARGDEIVIATASARTFVEPAAADLGIVHVIGTEMEMQGEVSTGRVPYVLDGTHKRDACVAFATSRGVALGDCWFYTDHIADLPLLEVVGHPVVVGPHPPLKALARAKGWAIVEHRRAPPHVPALPPHRR